MFTNLNFQYQVARRLLTILPRKSKSIRLLSFGRVPSADENFVTVKYRFTNAIYYKAGSLKTFSRNLRIQKCSDEQQVKLTVYGFFRKNEFIITLKDNDAYLTRVAQKYPVIIQEPVAERYPQLLSA